MAENHLDKYGRFNTSQVWPEGKAPIVRFVTDAGFRLVRDEINALLRLLGVSLCDFCFLFCQTLSCAEFPGRSACG